MSEPIWREEELAAFAAPPAVARQPSPPYQPAKTGALSLAIALIPTVLSVILLGISIGRPESGPFPNLDLAFGIWLACGLGVITGPLAIVLASRVIRQQVRGWAIAGIVVGALSFTGVPGILLIFVI
jgi:hypothetical protein